MTGKIERLRAIYEHTAYQSLNARELSEALLSVTPGGHEPQVEVGTLAGFLAWVRSARQDTVTVCRLGPDVLLTAHGRITCTDLHIVTWLSEGTPDADLMKHISGDVQVSDLAALLDGQAVSV